MIGRTETLLSSLLCSLVVLWTSGLDQESPDLLWFLHVVLVFLLSFGVLSVLAAAVNWFWRRFMDNGEG